MKRGEIWLVDLGPRAGAAGDSPCLIVSPRELNDHLHTVIVAPMAGAGQATPFRVPVTHAGARGLILLDQLHAVDKALLTEKTGAVTSKTLSAALAALQEVFAE